MDMMNSIASASMSISAAMFQQNYSIAVTKKMMDTEELALQELQEMLDAVPDEGIRKKTVFYIKKKLCGE